MVLGKVNVGGKAIVVNGAVVAPDGHVCADIILFTVVKSVDSRLVGGLVRLAVGESVIAVDRDDAFMESECCTLSIVPFMLGFRLAKQFALQRGVMLGVFGQYNIN